jgi:hypothetical protein
MKFPRRGNFIQSFYAPAPLDLKHFNPSIEVENESSFENLTRKTRARRNCAQNLRAQNSARAGFTPYPRRAEPSTPKLRTAPDAQNLRAEPPQNRNFK